jgi:peptidoglycan/LPS O-acetylase OafA/YrhL
MWFNQTPQILAVSVGIVLPCFAIAGYYLVERPCLQFGRRLTNPRPSKPSDLDSIFVSAS